MLRLKRVILLIFFCLFHSVNLFAQSEVILRDSSNISIDSLQLNITTNDSLSLNDSISTPPIPDSLIIIDQIGFSQQHINVVVAQKKEMDQYDFRYAGDIFSYLPFGFLQDLGNAGQPSELTFYGLGFNNIGYSQDGIGINDRITNSYDLNHIQSEYIDSLEVLPLSSGFLYNNRNNLVAVNFITRDSISTVPYSKIRFYQAPNSEEYLDVIFNAHILKRLTAAFEVTTQTVDSRFENSEFNSWKASIRLHYMFSNKLNLVGSYDFSIMQQGLNGGIDLEELESLYPEDQIEENFYNSVDAPVNYGIRTINNKTYSDRYQKSKKHNYTLKALGQFIPNSPTDITIYYQFYQKEFRQNELYANDEIPYIFDNSKYNNLGVSLRQLLNFGNLKLDLLAGYENTQLETDLYNIDQSISSHYIGGKVSYELLDKSIIPSLTLKQLNYDSKSYPGIGLDVAIMLNNQLNLFAGISSFSRPYNLYESQSIQDENEEVATIELGLKFNYSLIEGSFSYFDLEKKGIASPIIDQYNDSLKIQEVGFYNYSHLKSKGFNFNSQIHFSKFLLLANVTHIISDRTDNLQVIPDWSFTGGLYYVDTLFNNNLQLKTGVTFKYTGTQNYFIYDHQHSTSVRYQQPYNSNSFELINDSKTESGYQLDLFLAGTIQNAAIVYLVFENVTGSNYYISPYYPKQPRGFKVGLSWEFLD